MKIENSRKFEYSCQDTQELLALYILYPEELTADERLEVGKHIDLCPACREDYLGMKHTCDVLRSNREQLISSGVLNKHPESLSQQALTHEEIMERRFQDKLRRASIRRKRRERKERIASFKRLLRPISAIAACLAIGFGLFFAINQFKKVESGSSPIVSNQQHNQVRIKLISGHGTENIPAGQLIAAVDGLKTLNINNNRQMILNVGTELSIEPYNLGCLVKLDKGEIYTRVEHDGKPIIVETRHGRAVITGTTFNIKADNKKMDLVVIEGSVRFESAEGVVSVRGGYQSSVALGTKPMEPASCDVVKIAAWAKPQGLKEIACVGSEMSELAAISMPYRDLEEINYDNWIMENRSWFEREFPWINALQKSLLKDGISADPLDLLISSGVLMQFGYPEHGRTQLLCGQSAAMNRVALLAGLNENCSETMKFLASVSDGTKQSLGVEAFDQWLKAVENAGNQNSKLEGELILSSIHSVVFIKNTRTLVWFNVNNGRIQIAVNDKEKVKKLLEEQVRLAFDGTEKLKKLFFMDNNSSICKTEQYQEILILLKESVAVIKENEKGLTEYQTKDR
jgi:hypothetical protein